MCYKIKLNENGCKIISNEQMKKWILDYVEYAILRYDDEFGRTDYGFPFPPPPSPGSHYSTFCEFDYFKFS